jgi:hypothetical protein
MAGRGRGMAGMGRGRGMAGMGRGAGRRQPTLSLGGIDAWRERVIEGGGVYGGKGGELMKAYPFTQTCNSKLTCVVCKKRKPIAMGDTLCRKCCRSRYDEPIVDIPIESFISIILPYLAMFGKEGITTIVNCSRVSKSMYKYFNDNSIWKYLYIQKRSWELMDAAVSRACYSKDRKNESSSWSFDEVGDNPCKMVVKNMTDDIPYIVMYLSGRPASYGRLQPPRYMARINPGESYIAGKTYANHKWLCFPTREWWLKNPYSGVGFSFTIDPYNLTNHAFSSTKVMPAYVREIRNPKGPMKPLKGIEREFPCFKHQYMKLCVDPEKLARKMDVSSIEVQRDKKKLATLRKKMRALEESLAQHERQVVSGKMTKKIIKS